MSSVNRHLIVVEGLADIVFIKDFFLFLNADLKIKENNVQSKGRAKGCPSVVLISDFNEIKIMASGGYTKIKLLKNNLQEYIESDYSVYVIQDADDPSKSDGGVDNRLAYLSDLNLNLQIFLFPNNKDDGDLETLLLRIADTKNYNESTKYLTSYLANIKNLNTNSKFVTEMNENKNKLYHYVCVFNGMELAKEKNRKYTSNHWNFNSCDLNELKSFLPECS